MKVTDEVVLDQQEDGQATVSFGSVASWDGGTGEETEGNPAQVVRLTRSKNGIVDPKRTAELDLEDLVMLVDISCIYDVLSDEAIELMQASLNKALMRSQIQQMMEDLAGGIDVEDEDEPEDFVVPTKVH